jgi:hypothetical protein
MQLSLGKPPNRPENKNFAVKSYFKIFLRFQRNKIDGPAVKLAEHPDNSYRYSQLNC